MLKLVPFNSAWVDAHTLDIKAIYRRPHWALNEFDEWVQAIGPDGLPLWDLTTPQRVLNHNKLIAKGFEYITLASRDDLVKAARAGTIAGDWRQYDQHQTGGPWNAKMYLAGQRDRDTAWMQQLADDVARFGPDAVEELRQRADPHFRLPATLRAAADAEGEPARRGPGRPRKEAVA